MTYGETPPVTRIVAHEAAHGRPHPPLLLPLKPGTVMPPLYMAPGIGDSAAGLLPLAGRIRVGNPVYAFQMQGFDGAAAPHESIEDMAQFQLQGIRQLQPHGPYILIGYSLGGLITLEIARRLQQAGEKIALFAMLDTYPHRRTLRFRPRLRLLSRLAVRRVSGMLRLNPAPESGSRKPSNAVQAERSNAQALQRVKDAQERAWRVYRPRFYDGEVRYVRAAIPSFFPSDPVPVWSHLVRSLQVETVPGRHLEMVSTQVDAVATVLTRYVEEALAAFPQN
jgi:thioesterase domain-containing protein